MEVKTEIKGNDLYVSPAGRIDTETVSVFHDATQSLDFNKYDKKIFDLKDVEYISSAGLREFLVILKNVSNKDSLELRNLNSTVKDVFKMTGFDKMFNIANPSEKIIPYTNISFKDLLIEKAKIEKENGERKFLFDNKAYSWTDLDKCSQIVADDLAKLGVKKGSHVGIYGLNSVNWLITFFAVSKLGAIAELLNFNLKSNEVALLSRSADISYLCIGDLPEKDSKQMFEEIKSDGNSIVEEFYFFDKDIDYKDRYNEYPLLENKYEVKVEADDPAVVIFSSGSTGQPKAIMLSAYNLLNASYRDGKLLRIDRDDKLCLILPLFHAFGIMKATLAAMIYDAKIYMPENLKTSTILSLIDKEKCTLLYSVPTMLLALVNNKDFTVDKVSSIRCTSLAGSAISSSQMELLMRLMPNNHITNTYGLTEVGIATETLYEDTKEHILHTIGKPIDDTEVKIRELETLKDYLEGPSPEGEILLRGHRTMLCYYKLPIEDQPIDEEGWLHTGDVGKIEEDGYITLTGRIKDIIIRGGENITPNEIAAKISESDDIADVKVMGVPDEFYGEVVGAAIIMKNGKTFNEEELRNFLSDKLAKYKIPQYFVVYDAFPLLSNGKVDGINLKKDLIEKVKNL